MIVARLPDIELGNVDRVVAAVPFEGQIIVITENGKVFRVDPVRRG
jgi:hypothetical protein